MYGVFVLKLPFVTDFDHSAKPIESMGLHYGFVAAFKIRNKWEYKYYMY
jgi:hypothetical protein